MNNTVTLPIPYSQRREIAAYCSHTISPQEYYLHNGMGGAGWCVRHSAFATSTNDTGNWVVEATEADIIVLRLRLGV